MLTNCLAECAHLTITVSQIERDIGQKSSFFHTPLHSTPPLGGCRQNISTPFGVEKLESCGYPMVKKIRRYLYSFWRNSRTWQTDRQTPHADIYRAYAYASRGKNDRRYSHSYNGRWIETRAWSIECCHFQWPWVTPNLDFKVTLIFHADYLITHKPNVM